VLKNHVWENENEWRCSMELIIIVGLFGLAIFGFMQTSGAK